MPYVIRMHDEDGKERHCVYKQGAEGEPTGESLGCHDTHAAAEQQMRALYASEDDAKRVMPKSKWTLRVLGVPYGMDAHGQFFSEHTNLYLKPGETRPVMYAHGERPEGGDDIVPEQVGVAVAAERDEKGQWFDVLLDKTSAYARRLWDAAKNGLVRASSGTVDYLVRMARGGEILSWPIGELTLMDLGSSVHQPAHAGAVAYAKAYMKTLDGQFRSLETLAEAPQGQVIVEVDAKDAPLTESDPADTGKAGTLSAAEATGIIVAILGALEAQRGD